MAIELKKGYETVGYLDEFSDEPSPAYLTLTNQGADVIVPQTGVSLGHFFQANNPDYEAVPGTLTFRSTDGALILRGCQRSQTRTSSNGVGVVKIKARTVIKAGQNPPNYDTIDGMTSEIDGLAAWAEMSTVTRRFERGDDGLEAYSLRAEQQDPVELGGFPRASIISSFTVHTKPLGDMFGITDRALLRTRSRKLVDWQEHEAVHHMFQDLMCLVYGRPCVSRIVSVKRDDCQPEPVQMKGSQRWWNAVYQPDFGRTAEGIARLDRSDSRPLFHLSDVDPNALAAWISEWDLWSRPTWIAVTTMFQTGTTVEATLLQVGVALEALGYALWKQDDGHGGTPSFPELLERVTQPVHFPSDHAIYGTQASDEWLRLFNDAFKGAKHADNDLPHGLIAYQYARQGMNLIRAWTGIKLGVDPTSFGDFKS